MDLVKDIFNCISFNLPVKQVVPSLCERLAELPYLQWLGCWNLQSLEKKSLFRKKILFIFSNQKFESLFKKDFRQY